MNKPKKQRATTIVEWEHQGERGVLVHADRDGFWLLPGGGIERHELPLIAAARELHEETCLEATAVLFLFAHRGKVNDHTVFLARTSGEPTIVDEGFAQDQPTGLANGRRADMSPVQGAVVLELAHQGGVHQDDELHVPDLAHPVPELTRAPAHICFPSR